MTARFALCDAFAGAVAAVTFAIIHDGQATV